MLIRGNSYMDYKTLDIQMNPCFSNITAKTCLNNTLEKTKKYLGFPEIITLTDRQRVNTTELDEKVIVKDQESGVVTLILQTQLTVKLLLKWAK